MKRKFLTIVLSISALASYSQLPKNSLYLGNGIYGNVNHSGEKTTTSCTCTLDDVLVNGNVGTSNPLVMDDGFGNKSVMETGSFIGYFGSNQTCGLINSGGYSALRLNDQSTGYFSWIHSYVGLTANQHFYTNPTGGELVSNYVQTPVQIQFGANNGVHASDYFSLFRSGTYQGGFSHNSDNAGIHIYYKGGTNPYYTDVHSVNTTSSHVQTTPDDDGEYLLNHQVISTQTLTAATTMTIAHGLPYTPSNAVPIPKNPGAATIQSTGFYVSSITSTNIVITFNSAFTGTCSFSLQIFK